MKIRNGDGIDIDHSRHVRISNCHITSGDDCICLKNRREFAEYGSCHDIVVTNCTMSSRSCAIKIGSENMDSIYNVSIDNCIITRSNRGLGIQNRDEGTVTDVVFSNIIMDLRLWSDVWWGKAEPIYVTSYPRADGNNKDANWRFPKGETHGRCGEVSRIYFRSIVATSENGCFIGGEAGKVKDIHLDNVSLRLCHMTDYKGGIYDKRPCRGWTLTNCQPLVTHLTHIRVNFALILYNYIYYAKKTNPFKEGHAESRAFRLSSALWHCGHGPESEVWCHHRQQW